MKVKTTKVTIENDNGEIESVVDKTSIAGEYGELKFTFTIMHPEGMTDQHILKACASLGRRIETRSQIDAFDEKVA